MSGKPKKGPREKDLTSRYLSGGLDEDQVEDAQEHLKPRNKLREQEKLLRTSAIRAAEESGVDVEALPIGQVIQVYSRYCEVEHDGTIFLCVVRKTVRQISETQLVVGDRVRFRPVEGDKPSEHGQNADGSRKKDSPEAVIEQALPRQTVLTRADSFKGIEQHPIVANAEQMLIVASLREPRVKWGLIDRMLVAALSGGLRPIICLNKIDLAKTDESNPAATQDTDPDVEEFEAVHTINQWTTK
jgi:putative ribosome biogenesis GTPase RsgA